MRSKCEYCGSYIESTEENCPSCGAVNPNHQRTAAGVPQTMEELKDFCARHNLPLEQMRFFIGVDYKKPKAFGIFQDADGNFVVYKNKADGSRAIRYKGTDEAYAVHELYLKLQSEVQKQKTRLSASAAEQTGGKPNHQGRNTNRLSGVWASLSPREKKRLIGSLLLVLFFCSILAFDAMVPDKGYYSYEGSYYYYDYQDWYRFDREQLDWIQADMAGTPLDRHYNRYLIKNNNGSGNQYSESVDNEYYDAFSASQSVWDDDSSTREYSSGSDSSWDDSDWDDSDWDWDSGDDWDSSYTDWDSDW
ncbi:MAG: hypothetical protein ACI4O0_04375 [Candidatus Limivicinus sp.]